MSKRDKTTCTVIYQGQEADLDDKAAVAGLLIPMYHKIIRKENNPMARNEFLFPELEKTAIDLAYMVGRLEALEEEKAEVVKDFKERADLLKLQIKAAAKQINDRMDTTRMTVKAVPEEQPAAVQ